jgi:cytochrome c556
MKTHRALRTIICLAVGWALISGAVTSAVAHKGATGIVKERMEAMKGMSAAMKQIKAMLKGRADYDPARIAELSRAIARHSGESLVKVFPRGSLHRPSRAKPEVWEKWRVFKDLAGDMERHATALAESAANQKSAKKPFAALGDTCSACHKKFRVKKKKR